MTHSTNYIQHLHAFRGFAILNVVGAHAWSFMIFWTGGLNATGLNELFWATETLFHGSTLYFAIISGLLFQQILIKKSWRSFYQSKIANVLLPYILISFALTALYWQYILQNPAINNTLSDYFKVAATNVLSGKADIHFWYIPVLLVMFALTPLLAWLVHRSTLATWLLVLSPLFISRSPFPDFLMPQSFVYFIGAYVLGMVIGQHYEWVKQWVKKYKTILILITVVSSCSLFLLYVYAYQPSAIYSVRQTLVYIQKVAICLLVLYWFAQRETTLPHWILTLGSYAFAVYFLHVAFIGYSISFARPMLATSRTAELVAMFGSINFLVGIIGSLLTAGLLKRLLGRHARKVIGA